MQGDVAFLGKFSCIYIGQTIQKWLHLLTPYTTNFRTGRSKSWSWEPEMQTSCQTTPALVLTLFIPRSVRLRLNLT